MFQKVLVANRGEIAIRILRALREASVGSVAVYSEPDRDAPHVRMADEALPIGAASPLESYLCMDRVIAAAQAAGAEAIHPGYGFLAENPEFASACEKAGIVFIGPTPEAIATMGDKLAARTAAEAAGVPVVPGRKLGGPDPAEVVSAATALGFPLLLKSVGGGGGKGMRVVRRAEDVESAARTARSEAEKAFGNPEIYLERYLSRARHVEVQVAGDVQGNVVHLGERECSVQRRHQKLVEESPCPSLTPELRDRMTAAAVGLCRKIGYTGMGTVEFLADFEGEFYFLEMNTRLQVEHPVTELVTGEDLVMLQLRLAAGEPLGLAQEEVRFRGHAIEVRLCAEDPYRNFVPSVGVIGAVELPAGPGVRVDSGIRSGQEVTLYYDPLLAKVTVWAEDRTRAIARMRRALSELRVEGVHTTGPLAHQVLAHPKFVAGEWETALLETLLERSPDLSDGLSAFRWTAAAASGLEELELAGVAAAILRHAGERGGSLPVQTGTSLPRPADSPWLRRARTEGIGGWPE